MAVTDMPLLGMLRTKMQWHQARQKLLAENVANADMPGFRPRDLAQPSFDRATGLA
ncbi:flagellar basal body rod protein FlgB, partial [Methylobacterium sp. WL122]